MAWVPFLLGMATGAAPVDGHRLVAILIHSAMFGICVGSYHYIRTSTLQQLGMSWDERKESLALVQAMGRFVLGNIFTLVVIRSFIPW